MIFLPIALLIGAIIALAGLAQRNELVVMRVSGVSSRRLLYTSMARHTALDGLSFSTLRRTNPLC